MWRSPLSLGVAFGLIFVFALLSNISPVSARIEFQVDGRNYSAMTVQLWYEGLWKEVRQALGEQYSSDPLCHAVVDAI